MPDASLDYVLTHDPKHLLFTMARYKFVAKMLNGYDRVLEIGGGTGFGARIVAQNVNRLTVTDPDISQAQRASGIAYANADILFSPPMGRWDAVYCVDVFEHIAEEDLLLRNLRILAPVCIIGTPSLESQAYASVPQNQSGHVNCKSGEDLRAVCLKHWKRVFMFGQNDEVIHTGYSKMCHYLWALCVGD